MRGELGVGLDVDDEPRPCGRRGAQRVAQVARREQVGRRLEEAREGGRRRGGGGGAGAGSPAPAPAPAACVEAARRRQQGRPARAAAPPPPLPKRGGLGRARVRPAGAGGRGEAVPVQAVRDDGQGGADGGVRVVGRGGGGVASGREGGWEGGGGGAAPPTQAPSWCGPARWRVAAAAASIAAPS